MAEIDTTVFNGFPITVKFEIHKPEPDVGIFSHYIDDFEIVRIGNKKVKKYPSWLYDKIEKSPCEKEKLIEKLMEAGSDNFYDY